jgi:hypothetical protein
MDSMARSDLELGAEWVALTNRDPLPTTQELDELSGSWTQAYATEQAGKAGLDAGQHRRAAEDRERRRREAAGPGPVTTT